MIGEHLRGKTAFVTGGTGFIGGRLIEVLTAQFGMKVRTIVRGTSTGGGAFRAAAAGAEFFAGSLTDLAGMTEAVAGCDYVFHCAFGSSGTPAEQRRATVEGTRTVAQAAAAAGVAHFVNLGTMVSYGGDTGPSADESHNPAKIWNWPYANDKRDAEKALAEVHGTTGLPYTTLRLGVIYGPFGPAYTIMPIETLRAGRLALVDGGRGICPAAYVDDVIQAMILASARGDTPPDTFLIKGPDSVTWHDFYRSYEVMLGVDRLVDLSPATARAARREAALAAVKTVVPETLKVLKASAEFKRTAGALPLLKTTYKFIASRRKGGGGTMLAMPERAVESPLPIHFLPAMMAEFFGLKTEFSIDKARRVLGYTPQFDLTRGMAATQEWARWASLVP